MAAALFLLSLLLYSAASTPLAFNDPEPPKPTILQPGQVYRQSFDALAAHGRDHSFPPQDETGLQVGWWTSTPTYSASSGTPEPGVGGGIFSYGEEGSQERALGSRTSNRVRHTAWGLSLQIDPDQTSDIALWALDITYCGEQWSAGNGTSSLIFDYSIVSVDDYINGHKWGYYDVTPGLWMVKDRLSFTSPVVGGSERALDGNDPANRRLVKHTLAVDDVGKDQIVQLRWTHRNRDNVDHALAVDDLSVTLIPLKAYRSSSGHQRLHSMSWLYAGISVVGVVLTLIFAGLGIMLIVRRRRNEHESRESYARLALYNDEFTSDEEEAPPSATTSTSINPVDSDEYDASGSAFVRHSEL